MYQHNEIAIRVPYTTDDFTSEQSLSNVDLERMIARSRTFKPMRDNFQGPSRVKEALKASKLSSDVELHSSWRRAETSCRAATSHRQPVTASVSAG